MSILPFADTKITVISVLLWFLGCYGPGFSPIELKFSAYVPDTSRNPP